MAGALIGLLIGVASGRVIYTSKPTGPNQFFVAKHIFSGTSNNVHLARDEALGTVHVITDRVAERLHLDPKVSVSSKVVVEARPDVNLLYVAAGDDDEQRAVLLADTYAEELVRFLNETEKQQRQADVAEADEQLQNLRDEYERNQLTRSMFPGADNIDDLEARQLELSSEITDAENERSSTATEPVVSDGLFTLGATAAAPAAKKDFDALVAAAPNDRSSVASTTGPSEVDATLTKSRYIGLPLRSVAGMLAGLAGGLVVVLALARLDPRIRTKRDAEEAFALPVIGEVPRLDRTQRRLTTIFVNERARSRSAEAYRTLRLSLDLAAMNARPASTVDDLLLEVARGHIDRELRPAGGLRSDDGTGPRADGLVVLVTSASPAEGKTTTVANLAAAYAERGARVLVVNCDFRRPRIHRFLGADLEPNVVRETGIERVDLIADVAHEAKGAGTGDIASRQRELIREARADYDVVLLDTAPILATNDVAEVLAEADLVVLVARGGRTNPESAFLATELLERRKAPVAGVVLVGVVELPPARDDDFEAKDPEGAWTPDDPDAARSSSPVVVLDA